MTSRSPRSRAASPHRVVMLAFPDAQILDVVGPLEVFSRTSRWLAETWGGKTPAYETEVTAVEAGPVRTSQGLELTARRLAVTSTRMAVTATRMAVTSDVRGGHPDARGGHERLAYQRIQEIEHGVLVPAVANDIRYGGEVEAAGKYRAVLQHDPLVVGQQVEGPLHRLA